MTPVRMLVLFDLDWTNADARSVCGS